MDRQSVLEKAIISALNNGWKPYGNSYVKPLILSERIDRKRGIIGWSINETKGYKESLSALFASENDIIYNHQFAKCLWGEYGGTYLCDCLCDDCDLCREFWPNKGELKNYEYHLAKMVLADDPIAYLAEHMPQ